jgi:uncharacterized membrane protein
MDNFKNFWNQYKGAIIGIIIAILILVTRLHDLILAVVVLILGAFIGNYIQQNKEDVKTKFGALYNAFQYGTPPHAGAAPGLDRMVMLIADSKNIREVIAFPKNKKARDVMMGAPSRVNKAQLDDVHIILNDKK